MNGLSDDKEDIVKSCYDLIEKAGDYRKVKFIFNLETCSGIRRRVD